MPKRSLKLWVSFLILSIFANSAYALSCKPPSKNPFEESANVFLAQVTKSSAEKKISGGSVAAPIRILKVYKGDVAQIKQFETISSWSWLGTPDPFVEGTTYLLYDRPSLGDCEFINGQINEAGIKQFEVTHPPLWVSPDIQTKDNYESSFPSGRSKKSIVR